MAICSRNVKDLEQLKNELQTINANVQIFARATDCSHKPELLEFARQAEAELGYIKVVVNNVGNFRPGSILNDADDAFTTDLNTNLMPAYELYRYFGKSMMAQRSGHFFNICSVAAIEPVVNAGIYSVTKAALRSLTHIMKLEMQAYSVKVTAVLPGSTLTGSWAGSDVQPDRFVMPDDIAAAILNAYNMSKGANVDEIVIKPVLGQL